ncbi:MAG TPA: hypothetical protein DIW30_06150 [Bacteroidales bacterium]|nr:hypothetical protein [Bacteroidales bacterium]
MTIEDYLLLLESPESVDESAIDDLKAMLRYAPYCSSAQVLLLKALHRSHDTNYASHLHRAVLYAHSNEQLYFLLHPKEIIRQADSAYGDYFSFVKQLQEKADETGQSFHDLALKFQQARLAYITPRGKKAASVETFSQAGSIDEKPILTEENARQCIQKRDYRTALEILRALNLHNPKKSSYFADQIAFLEKAIALQEEGHGR